MKIAIDYPTVIMTDEDLWRDFLYTLTQYQHHEVIITYSRDTADEAQALEDSINSDNVKARIVYEDERAQDLLGADIWIHGRVDRVIGTEQLDFLVTNMKASLTD